MRAHKSVEQLFNQLWLNSSLVITGECIHDIFDLRDPEQQVEPYAIENFLFDVWR